MLSFIFSDQSGQGYEDNFDAYLELDGLNMFYTIDKWKMSQRQWVEYPDEVLNPLTTLEETKAATCIIITSQYCEALQEKHKDSAKII